MTYSPHDHRPLDDALASWGTPDPSIPPPRVRRRQDAGEDGPETTAPDPPTSVRQPRIGLAQLPPSEAEVGARVRDSVGIRAQEFGKRHADNFLVQITRGDPISRYAIMFHFIEPDQRPSAVGHFNVRSAYRFQVNGPETASLAGWLEQLTIIARSYGDALDVRRDMCTNQEPIERDARYLGLTVSALGYPTDDTVPQETSGLFIPGSTFTHLSLDNTYMVITRTPQGRGDLRHLDVVTHSSRPLDVRPMNRAFLIPWRDLACQYGPRGYIVPVGVDTSPGEEVWAPIWHLNDLAVQAHRRIAQEHQERPLGRSAARRARRAGR